MSILLIDIKSFECCRELSIYVDGGMVPVSGMKFRVCFEIDNAFVRTFLYFSAN